MRKIFCILFFCAVILPCVAHSQPKASKGRSIVQAAVAYQSKLQDSTVTLDDVLHNWDVTARDPEVRKDQDALAIAYGCEALIEVQKGRSHSADSLFRKALPLFRFKSSKESILVAYAEFERGLKNNADAMRAYDEIVHTMDSVGTLWDIEYYRLSGYAPYAYAIDASFGMAQIAASDPKQKQKAIELLQNTFDRHPNDALGMMTIVALHRLGAMDDEAYKFQVDLLCSRKPELRDVNELFEKKFSEAK